MPRESTCQRNIFTFHNRHQNGDVSEELRFVLRHTKSVLIARAEIIDHGFVFIILLEYVPNV